MTATIHRSTAPTDIADSGQPAIAHRRSQPWSNWGQTAHCQPDYSFYPRTVEDLIAIVRFARENGKKIRAVGSGHSWSALVPTDEILVFVAAMNHVEMDLSDPEHPRVVMECGATVLEVNTVLEQAGYALPFNVVLESVRFGGLIATGSHGSGWNHQTLSDLVHSIEIVTASGDVRKFEMGVDSPEVMSAVRLNLGMFGLIHRITMKVQKSWTVRQLDRRIPVTETLDNLQEWVTTHDNMDVFWWPFNDRFWVKTWHRVDQPITARPRYSARDRIESAITSRLFYGGLTLQSMFPRLTPAACKFSFLFTPSKNDAIVDIVEAVHYRRSIEVVKTGCLEIGFKVDRDFANVRWAIQLVRESVEAHARRNAYPMNLTLNVRFNHNSDCLLSPASGEGHTCFIEILSRTLPSRWEKFAGDIAKEWLSLPQARPHWAKEFRYIPGIIEHIRRVAGSNIDRFNQIKAQLGVDPDHMFVNNTLREIFL